MNLPNQSKGQTENSILRDWRLQLALAGSAGLFALGVGVGCLATWDNGSGPALDLSFLTPRRPAPSKQAKRQAAGHALGGGASLMAYVPPAPEPEPEPQAEEPAPEPVAFQPLEALPQPQFQEQQLPIQGPRLQAVAFKSGGPPQGGGAAGAAPVPAVKPGPAAQPVVPLAQTPQVQPRAFGRAPARARSSLFGGVHQEPGQGTGGSIGADFGSGLVSAAPTPSATKVEPIRIERSAAHAYFEGQGPHTVGGATNMDPWPTEMRDVFQKPTKQGYGLPPSRRAAGDAEPSGKAKDDKADAKKTDDKATDDKKPDDKKS